MKKSGGHMKRHWKKYFIIGIILLNTAFAIAILCLFSITQSEPDTLITYWFIFTGTELVAMAGVESVSTIKGKKKLDEGGDTV